ncbi:XrtA/PEP-CTERM system exopolysaccharide export protein [Psychromonas antarctica]|jgi:polysaccharide export outer membrane protein|uniref:XrtA/PEP-CTERM system exopolysaccharide export protein n=1 Tax=Psychromonas antarctica TaxID=67573 RepID=UPI001EE79663|nr:XrtA/PEP-CTERM system exopolysaccharide export protein [Psychromonas antarctica]MCG6200938.1 polysaccharide biosynthesis/export family protein [Psychromonas antarctica]
MGKLILLALSFGLLTSCSTPLDSPEQGIAIQEIPEYKIGAGDQLYINVWQNPDLSLSVAVRPDGKISVPLIGDAKAVGSTAEDLAANLSDQLDKFIRNPEVTVIVTSAISSEFLTRVRITGAVQLPQTIPYRQGMTILDLVLQAGGLSVFADGDNAILYRKTNEGTKRYPVRLDSIMKEGDIATDYELRPSDTLIVPESVF